MPNEYQEALKDLGDPNREVPCRDCEALYKRRDLDDSYLCADCKRANVPGGAIVTALKSVATLVMTLGSVSGLWLIFGENNAPDGISLILTSLASGILILGLSALLQNVRQINRGLKLAARDAD